MLPLSLPSRERGLKFSDEWEVAEKWKSLPSRERGLKSKGAGTAARGRAVAPFAGAWIEITFVLFLVLVALVAPFAGAWIEI